MWLPPIRPPLRYGLRVLRVVLEKHFVRRIFNFTLRRNNMRFNYKVRSINPLSITLRATDFEAILRGTLC